MVDFGGVQNIALDVAWALVLSLAGLLIIGIVGLVWYLILINKQYKKHEIHIYKRQRDNKGKYIPVFVGIDQGRIKKDRKTKRWVFHVRKINIDLGEEEGYKSRDEDRELNLPTIPAESGKQILFLEKLAPRKYAIMQPIDIDGQVKVNVSEADVAEAVRVYDVNTKLFSKDNNALWTFAIYTVFGVLILIMVVYLLNKFEVLVAVANSLENAANTLAQNSNAAVPSNAAG